MRNKNPFERELVDDVYRQINEGNRLDDAIAETIANPPSYIYPLLRPTPETVRQWFLNKYPNYLRVETAAVAQDLSRKGYSDLSIARRFGVTTQTVRNWLNG